MSKLSQYVAVLAVVFLGVSLTTQVSLFSQDEASKDQGQHRPLSSFLRELSPERHPTRLVKPEVRVLEAHSDADVFSSREPSGISNGQGLLSAARHRRAVVTPNSLTSGDNRTPFAERLGNDVSPNHSLVTVDEVILPSAVSTADASKTDAIASKTEVGELAFSFPEPISTRGVLPALLENEVSSAAKQTFSGHASEFTNTSAIEWDSSVSQARKPAKLIFQPAVPVTSSAGVALLRPQVSVGGQGHESALLSVPSEYQSHLPSLGQGRPVGAVAHVPREVGSGREVRIRQFDWNAWPAERGQRLRMNLFDPDRERLVYRFLKGNLDRVHNVFSGLSRGNRRGRYDVGVGRERLPYALFEIDPAQPFNNLRLRFEAAYNLLHPYRAEFFWSDSNGPSSEDTSGSRESVDYQQARIQFETGGPRMTLSTEIPLVFIDPTRVGNVAGLGDLVLTTKTLMLDGDKFQLMQVLRTQLATGASKTGRGNGHVSMEPGLVTCYRLSDDMLIHSELKLWFPMGATSDVAGEILRCGMGAAKVLYDSDRVAVIPTIEFVAWSLLSGKQYQDGTKTSATSAQVELDGKTILNVFPGLRIVSDTGGDFGLFEVGLNAGLATTSVKWYQSMMRLDLRWSF